MVGMIENISDHKSTFFFSNDNTSALNLYSIYKKTTLLVARMRLLQNFLLIGNIFNYKRHT